MDYVTETVNNPPLLCIKDASHDTDHVSWFIILKIPLSVTYITLLYFSGNPGIWSISAHISQEKNENFSRWGKSLGVLRLVREFEFDF